jgi:hypothetical protein
MDGMEIEFVAWIVGEGAWRMEENRQDSSIP